MKVAAVFCALLSVAAAFQPMPVRMTAPRIVMSAKRSAPARMPVAPMAAALPIASLVAAAPADAMPLDGSSVDVSLTAFQIIGFSPILVAAGWALIIIGPGFIQQFARLFGVDGSSKNQ